jgi:hypothetical protein
VSADDRILFGPSRSPAGATTAEGPERGPLEPIVPSVGKLVGLDEDEAVGVLWVLMDHVVLHLVGVHEAELAVRAVVRMQLIENR